MESGLCSNEVHVVWGRALEISEGAGESFLAILDLMWVTTPKLDSGMTCGVGIRSSRLLSQTCLVWLDLRKLSG